MYVGAGALWRSGRFGAQMDETGYGFFGRKTKANCAKIRIM